VTGQAIDRASAFLAGQQHPDQLWHDFSTLAGHRSDWVTAFVACSMADAGCRGDLVADARTALLARQRSNGGWAYNESVPTDCDSSAWALLLLANAPSVPRSAVRLVVEYIKAHQVFPDGGFCTYSSSDGIAEYIGAAKNTATTGWLSAHPCVTAVAVKSLLASVDGAADSALRSAMSYLKRARGNSHVWRSYWWKGYGYCTYHTLDALRSSGQWRALYDGSVAFLLAHQNRDGGWNDSDGGVSEVFATAWSILTLMIDPSSEVSQACERARVWLVGCQLPNGAWPVMPILRIPPPNVTDVMSVKNWRPDRKGAGAVIRDDAGVFTAASALRALSAFEV